LIGIITAFMTSFYMFRLLFMTFFNEYRGAVAVRHTPPETQSHGGPAPAEHAGRTHAVPIGGQQTAAQALATSAHDHGVGHGEPHESPWVMVLPLVLLAALSIIGGYVGVPKALHGSNEIEHFLAPVMPAITAEAAGTAPGGAHPEQEQSQATEDTSLELTLTGVSVVVAFAGLGLAWLLYVKRRDLPAKIADSLGGLYTSVLNKYFVDEIYGAAIIGPLIAFSSRVLWRGIDATLIDGSVNSGARGVREIGDSLRHQQSGNIRTYAGWVTAGAALVILYMVWMGTR
jgi:NADH-quinone oxidoreductase subunit L